MRTRINKGVSSWRQHTYAHFTSVCHLSGVASSRGLLCYIPNSGTCTFRHFGIYSAHILDLPVLHDNHMTGTNCKLSGDCHVFPPNLLVLNAVTVPLSHRHLTMERRSPSSVACLCLHFCRINVSTNIRGALINLRVMDSATFTEFLSMRGPRPGIRAHCPVGVACIRIPLHAESSVSTHVFLFNMMDYLCNLSGVGVRVIWPPPLKSLRASACSETTHIPAGTGTLRSWSRRQHMSCMSPAPAMSKEPS